MTSTEKAAQTPSESSSPSEADWCRCDHQRATHEAKGMPGCMAYGCSCPSFEYEDGPRKPGPCENGCKAAAGELAQQTQDMERCAHESWRVTGEWYDLPARKWWKSRRCEDCGEALDNVLEAEPTFSEPKGPGSDRTPGDPFEGEQGNCLHGMSQEDHEACVAIADTVSVLEERWPDEVATQHMIYLLRYYRDRIKGELT